MGRPSIWARRTSSPGSRRRPVTPCTASARKPPELPASRTCRSYGAARRGTSSRRPSEVRKSRSGSASQTSECTARIRRDPAVTYRRSTNGSTLSPSISWWPARRSTTCTDPARSTRTSVVRTVCSRRGDCGWGVCDEVATMRPSTPTSRPSTTSRRIAASPGPTTTCSRSLAAVMVPSSPCAIRTPGGACDDGSRGTSLASPAGAVPACPVHFTDPSGHRAVTQLSSAWTSCSDASSSPGSSRIAPCGQGTPHCTGTAAVPSRGSSRLIAVSGRVVMGSSRRGGSSVVSGESRRRARCPAQEMRGPRTGWSSGAGVV